MEDNNNKIFTIASSIVRLSNRLTEIWANLDYYEKNKVLMDDSSSGSINVNDMEVHEIVTKLLTLPSFISKSKKKLKTMSDSEEKTKLQNLINNKEMELQAIKNLRFKNG